MLLPGLNPAIFTALKWVTVWSCRAISGHYKMAVFTFIAYGYAQLFGYTIFPAVLMIWWWNYARRSITLGKLHIMLMTSTSYNIPGCLVYVETAARGMNPYILPLQWWHRRCTSSQGSWHFINLLNAAKGCTKRVQTALVQLTAEPICITYQEPWFIRVKLQLWRGCAVGPRCSATCGSRQWHRTRSNCMQSAVCSAQDKPAGIACE
jgi:hypothetical protein